MAETTIITTIELTNIMPIALDDIALNNEYAEEYKKSLAKFLKAHFPITDDTRIKVQLFVNDETEE